jgi:hypothetical protein
MRQQQWRLAASRRPDYGLRRGITFAGKKHTCDQNAERDVIETVRENMMHGVALTTLKHIRALGIAT